MDQLQVYLGKPNSNIVATAMTNFAAKLQPPNNTPLSGEERALWTLATECQSLANQILDILEKVKPKKRRSKGSSLLASLMAKFYESERRSLEERLGHCRSQLDLPINWLTR
jgi:hypothetical protein